MLLGHQQPETSVVQTFPVLVVRFTFDEQDVQHELQQQASRSIRSRQVEPGGRRVSRFLSCCRCCSVMDEGITAISCKMDGFQWSG